MGRRLAADDKEGGGGDPATDSNTIQFYRNWLGKPVALIWTKRGSDVEYFRGHVTNVKGELRAPTLTIVKEESVTWSGAEWLMDGEPTSVKIFELKGIDGDRIPGGQITVDPDLVRQVP